MPRPVPWNQHHLYVCGCVFSGVNCVGTMCWQRCLKEAEAADIVELPYFEPWRFSEGRLKNCI